MRQRLISAFHEAGHAVVAELLGVPVAEVTIDADGGGGLCRFDSLPLHRSVEGPTQEEQDKASRELEVYLAGVVAAAYAGASREENDGDEDDLTKVSEFVAAFFPDDDAQVVVDERIDFVTALVTIHWRAVEAIAAVLDEAGRITGSEVAAIVGARHFKILAEHPRGAAMIRDTLSKLPDDVQRWAAACCVFTFVDAPGMPGGAYSHQDCALDPSDRVGLYLIGFVGVCGTYFEAGLVQEIALAYAGCRPNRDGVSDDEVNRAAAQAAAWGFDGPGVQRTK
ncbi:MAG: hypothetical protein IT450_16775 [Phycisphaerales bacterium]|nr:hypothetical protein [Phycisphaerales bacterium]